MAQKSEISIETTNAATNGTTTNTTKANPSSPKSRLAVLKRTKKASNAASDPFRFQNNGISYKGKLIGEQDVDTARGDAMCAEAMRNAKGIIKAAGAHKTRITLQINIDGIKVLDEKSGAVLHNFPVSRISFIARDSSDARAFGLVYGEPGGKYKFYGIKTAQSADQAVLAIRDMFQVVFEMKKKHIEQVKLQQKTGGADVSFQKTKEEGVAVADLLDLESELQQIEQGVQQLSTLPTNFDAFGASPFGDPFADSFNTTANSTANSTATMNMSANSQQRSFPAAFGIQQPPVPTTMPACQDWPTNTAATTAAVAPSPFGAWAPMDHVPMHHAQSTPAFGSNSFAETNPFASAFGAPVPVPTAPVPTVTAPPPPPQQQLRDPFLVSSSNALQGTIDWNGTHGTTKENMAPIVSQPLHHANTFANFGDNKTTSWEEKKVTSLEEAFTKLVDMDALIGGGSAVQETKKNPFEHILNPPKASLNSLSTTCSSQMVASQHAQQHTAADPFGDDFFR